MRRVFGQLGLADGLVTRRSGSLEQIAGVLDWGSLAALMCAVQAAPTGRPGYGPLVLLRCVLLQQWYGLSDPALEEALNDRLSFRHFVGLSLSDPVPDHSTLSRFRKVLVEQHLGERLLAEVNRQLEAKGADPQARHLGGCQPGGGECTAAAESGTEGAAFGSRCGLERDAEGCSALRLQGACGGG